MAKDLGFQSGVGTCFDMLSAAGFAKLGGVHSARLSLAFDVLPTAPTNILSKSLESKLYSCFSIGSTLSSGQDCFAGSVAGCPVWFRRLVWDQVLHVVYMQPRVHFAILFESTWGPDPALCYSRQ